MVAQRQTSTQPISLIDQLEEHDDTEGSRRKPASRRNKLTPAQMQQRLIELETTLACNEHQDAIKMRKEAARDAGMIRDQRYLMREMSSALIRLKSKFEEIEGAQPIVDELKGYIQRCLDLPYKPNELQPASPQERPSELATDNDAQEQEAAIHARIAQDFAAKRYLGHLTTPLPFEYDGTVYQIVNGNLDKLAILAQVADTGSFDEKYRTLHISEHDAQRLKRACYERLCQEYAEQNATHTPLQQEEKPATTRNDLHTYLTTRHDKPIKTPRTAAALQKRVDELEHDIEVMHAAKIYQELHPDWTLVELQAENVRQRETIATILDNTERLITEKDQLQQRLTAAETELAEVRQQLASCHFHINDQAETIDQLTEENRQLRTDIAELEDENREVRQQPATRPATIVVESDPHAESSLQAELERVRESEQRYKDFLNWTLDLYHNPTIPNSSTKLVLWYFYYLFFTMRPTATDEKMHIGVEATAEALGVGKGTVRNATDKAEMWEVLKREYEDIKLKDGSKITLAHITLNDIMNDPNRLKMEKLAGGKRVPKCPVCGSENVDRYTLQYCRECNKNDWYVQPGTRKDAPHELAQRAENRAVYAKDKTDKNQDGFYTSPDEMPATPESEAQHPEPVAAHHQLLEQDHHHEHGPSPIVKLLTDRQATTGITRKNQDGFNSFPDEMPAMRETCSVCDREVEYYSEQGEAFCSQHFMPARPARKTDKQFAHKENTPAPSPLPAPSLPMHWKMIDHPPVCHAQFWLNKDGKRAGALEKVVAVKECGSTHWNWSTIHQQFICANPDCRTPLPEEQEATTPS